MAPTKNSAQRAADLLRRYHQLTGGPIPSDPEERSHRYHKHLREAGRGAKEHNLLITTDDRHSNHPFGTIATYLDDLRSGHNVGSILRTIEALRLGPLFFSNDTPFIDNAKVQNASMGTYHIVPTHQISELSHLPRPLIALETSPTAPPIYEFSFPSICTLLLGNEEFGLSKTTLASADHIVQIPLLGNKNSLNVACAFALAAGQISASLSRVG